MKLNTGNRTALAKTILEHTDNPAGSKDILASRGLTARGVHGGGGPEWTDRAVAAGLIARRNQLLCNSRQPRQGLQATSTEIAEKA